MILSFNFLQPNYFPREQIAPGVANLTNALNEQGFLIIGNDESFSVAQKRAGKLVVIKEDRSPRVAYSRLTLNPQLCNDIMNICPLVHHPYGHEAIGHEPEKGCIVAAVWQRPAHEQQT